MRNTTLWIATTLVSLMAVGTAPAFEINSTYDSITSAGETFSFDFNGDPDLALLESTDYLVKIRVDWVLSPGPGQTETTNLLANLQVDNDDVNLDLNAAVPAGTIVYAHSETAAPSGLTFSQKIVDSLLDPGTYGDLDGILISFAPHSAALNEFFANGGVVSGFVTLTFEKDPGGSGEVPEPASLLVWSGLAGCGLVYRRRQKKNKLAKV